MKILLAVDPSPASRTAVDEVAARPWPAGTQVEVLTVIDVGEPWALSPIVEELQAVSSKLVEEAASRLRSRGLDASGTVAQGDPRAAIVDQATDAGADLIVVGAHGASAIDRFLLGSVSRALLRFAPCSVEIVRKRAPKDTAKDTPGAAALKILLAVDGSESSRHAAASLAARPWPPGTEVKVLSAVELRMSALQAAFEIPALDADHLEKQRAAAIARTENAIDEARATLEAAGLLTSQSISVLAESPKEIILREAAEWPADMIVLGSHGSSGLSRFLLGSTSEEVSAHAACSIEVIRVRA